MVNAYQCRAEGGQWKDNKCKMPVTKSVTKSRFMPIFTAALFIVAVILTMMSFGKKVQPTGLFEGTIETILGDVGIFFDHFGVLIFAFFTWVGINDLSKNVREFKFRWISWITLSVGIAGLIVDGSMIFTNAVIP